MFRFFRQIRQRFLTENRFSKYFLYAVGEILLVVIGILIALEVNNRNDEFKEKKVLLSELKNAQTYIQDQIEKEEDELQLILAWRDTIQHALQIIEEVEFPSPLDDKYLRSSRTHMMKVGLRTVNVNTMYNLSVSLSKSKTESRHELIESINQLIVMIQQGTRLEESFFDDLLRLSGSVHKSTWRRNSRGEVYYDFNLMKNDYNLQYLFLQSIVYKGTSAAWRQRIMERYTLIHAQIKDLLRELDD